MTAQLKICGIVRREDVETCHDLGVEAIGINLWRGSPRGLPLDEAAALVDGVRPGGPLRVGVLVDPSRDELLIARARLGLDLVQLHGDAPISRYAGLGVPYIWVIRGTPELATLAIPSPAPAWVLLDTRVLGYGGKGVQHDWAWAKQAVAHFAPLPVWLAGGIGPDNVRAAIDAVGPAGIDVASGAEPSGVARLGTKDRDRIAALRSACAGW